MIPFCDPFLGIVQARFGVAPEKLNIKTHPQQPPRSHIAPTRQGGYTDAALALDTAFNQPGSLTLLLSPSLRQSQELFRTVMGLYHQLPYPMPMSTQSTLRLELVNGSRIVALPAKEQTVRGYAGVNLLVVDEAARVDDELYFAIRPMLAVSGGRLIALSTPFGRRGFFFNEWEEGGEDWHRTMITATDVPRISAEFLEEERAALGHWYRQEYFCEFVETTDSVFGYDTIMAAMSADVQPLFGGIT